MERFGHTADSLLSLSLSAIIQQEVQDFSPLLHHLQGRTHLEKGGNKNKHMQELGFQHPTKISLSAVIALTRGFLMLLQVS